ncbi:MAG: hypothetical protein QOD72_1222 [Acidimicrobiaceae bacterium]|nr:hypothetical protein [Acidimicrobiaceae bacterium]
MTMPSAIDAAKVDALLERARREVDEGFLPSVQIALAYDGEVVVDETYGDATAATRYSVFSATKAFVASTVWTLIGDGRSTSRSVSSTTSRSSARTAKTSSPSSR